MSKQGHSKVWSQHQTFLKSQSKQQQKEHEGKTKKEKSQAVAMWSLEKKAPKFHHQSQEVGAQTSHLQREKWVSWKKLLEEWTEDEIWAHLDSERIRGRESSTWGVWEYTDTQDVEKLKKAFKGNTWKQGMEYQPTSEDELVFQEQWSKGATSMLQRLDNTGHALQKGNEKGKGKSKGKGKGKGKAGTGLPAIKDKEEGASEKEEGDSEKEDPDEAMKDAMEKSEKGKGYDWRSDPGPGGCIGESFHHADQARKAEGLWAAARVDKPCKKARGCLCQAALGLASLERVAGGSDQSQ